MDKKEAEHMQLQNDVDFQKKEIDKLKAKLHKIREKHSELKFNHENDLHAIDQLERRSARVDEMLQSKGLQYQKIYQSEILKQRLGGDSGPLENASAIISKKMSEETSLLTQEKQFLETNDNTEQEFQRLASTMSLE